MELKNKIPAPVGDVQKVARALLSWLNGFPDKPVKKIAFEHLESEDFGMTVLSMQAAYKTKTYLRGRYQAQYPFQILYRAQPSSDNKRLEMDEILNQIGAWAETNPDKPELEGNAKVLKITRDSSASMINRYEGGAEDHSITMNLIYEVT